MMNINGIVNKANERARVALETEVIRVVDIVEGRVLEHYFGLLEPLQQGLDMLYNELEKPNFNKLPRKEFDELVYENFQTRLESVMISYLNNAKSLALKIASKQQADEFLDFMQQYKVDLLKQDVKEKRINMEARKILYTMNRRLFTMLNSFGENSDKQFSAYCEYLLNSIDFYRDNYTVDVNAPKIEDIEVEIEREGYEKITDRHELEELVLANGFRLKRITGSHYIYENAEGKVTVIPMHSCDIGLGLSRAIQKQIREN